MLKKLPKRIFLIWELLFLSLFAVLVLLTLYILAPYSFVWYAVLWIEGLLAIYVVFLYIPLYYVNFAFNLSEEYMVLKCGVIWAKERYLQRSKVCFVSLNKNPISSLLRVCSLHIAAPGGDIVLYLIPISDATEIQKQLTPSLQC